VLFVCDEYLSYDWLDRFLCSTVFAVSFGKTCFKPSLHRMSVSDKCYCQVSVDSKVRLSGYGVELAIKSTEYKAKDDTVITGNILAMLLSY